MQIKKPIIQKDVAEYLETLFPMFIPNPKDSINEMFFKAGQASVAEHIKQMYERQKEESAISSL